MALGGGSVLLPGAGEVDERRRWPSPGECSLTCRHRRLLSRWPRRLNLWRDVGALLLLPLLALLLLLPCPAGTTLLLALGLHLALGVSVLVRQVDLLPVL